MDIFPLDDNTLSDNITFCIFLHLLLLKFTIVSSLKQPQDEFEYLVFLYWV